MIDILHPLRDIIERHWPIPATTDPDAAVVRRVAIDDLIEDLDNANHWTGGCSCPCESCEDCTGSDW